MGSPKRTAERTKRFAPSALGTISAAKLIRIRSGETHRFTGVWTVVVRDRVFVRSWNDDPGGWRRAFRANPAGALRCNDLELAVRARAVRESRLLAEIDEAYAAKYHTKASRQWVQGLCLPSRRRTTTELRPRTPA